MAKRNLREIVNYLEFFVDLGVQEVVLPAATPQYRLATSQTKVVLPVPRSSCAPHEGKSLFAGTGPSDPDLPTIREDLGDCRRCKLHPTRKNIVFGHGNPRAKVMFIGEAPGADEDIQGLPFVGRAGQLLTKIIESIGFTREEVYITNILKCRPPGNRNPEADEIAACQEFLFRQIEVIRPLIICTLGTFACQTLLQVKTPISKLRGQMLDFRGTKLIATFHPAYLLRNPAEKRKVWEDVQKLRAYYDDHRG